MCVAQQERKRVLEAERQARVEELLMKRKEQEARIEQQRQEKERAREDAARERARCEPVLCSCMLCYLTAHVFVGFTVAILSYSVIVSFNSVIKGKSLSHLYIIVLSCYI